MPANLTPEYYEAERKYRLAKDPVDKIVARNTFGLKTVLVMTEYTSSVVFAAF